MDQRLVPLCKEKIEERKQRKSNAMKGLSKGVLIHFQSHVMVFSSRNAVRAIRVTMWIMVMAHGCTDARARGVKMIRA